MPGVAAGEKITSYPCDRWDGYDVLLPDISHRNL